MIFSNEESNIIYCKLYNWLASHSVGQHTTTKSFFKFYQNNVWDPILNKINLIMKKPNPTSEETNFLNLVLYKGTIYRFHNYNPKKRGHIYPMPFYQSWSKSIDGLLNINGYNGKLLLIKGNSNLGIDIFELLCFLLKNKCITDFNNLDPKLLINYENEKEIAHPITIANLEEIYIVLDKNNISKSINENNCLPKEKWFRNNLN